MHRRSMLSLLVLTAACVTPALTLNDKDGTETDVGVDETDTDGVVDTDDTVVVDTDDTAGWLTDTDTDGGGPTGPGTPLNCHPFDPVSYSGWTRKYRINFPGTSGWENHAGTGYSPLPQQVTNNFPSAVPVVDGYGYTVNISGAGSNNLQSEYWTVCDYGGAQGAYDIGYSISADGSTLRAGAKDPHKYLPKEIDMYAQVLLPNWTHEGKYKMKVPVPNIIPNCASTATATRDVTATYASFGFETLNIAALGGNVDAYRLNVVLEQSISVASDPNPICNIFGSTFGAVFAELFGSLFGNVDSDTGEFAKASFDRWYVRGVGLVKEEAYDISIPSQPVSLYDKELTQCGGLPSCP